MRIDARRGRRITPVTTWAAIVVALVVHGTLLATVHAVGVKAVNGFGATAKVIEEPELQTGCVGNVALASTARFTMCFAPWQTEVDACLHDAQMNVWIDLSSCQAQHEQNIAQVSMLDKQAADKVKPIDPEPLIEELREQEKPKPQVVPPPQPQQPAPPPPPPPQARVRPMQVVETAKPTEEKAPDNARFLAEYDTNVKKQTVARGAVKEPMVAKSKPEELAAKETPKEASVQEHPDRDRGKDKKAPDVPGTLAMRNPGANSPAEAQQDQKVRGSTTGASGNLALDGYVPKKGQGAFEQQQHDRSEIPRGQNGAGGGAPDVLNLKPNQDVLERALGGGNVDHLEEVDNGDETALSAKRWVYASFFNRLKRQVAQNWDPATVWRRSDPTGQVYGFKTRVTEVRVSLSAKGELSKIVVTTPCGVSDLDDEAVRAFHAAGPFPNPPKELASADGLITFAFSFYFEIGAPHTSWRVIRSM
jgi:TonB family protein